MRVVIAGTRGLDRERARAALRRGFDKHTIRPVDIEAIATGDSGNVDELGRQYAAYYGVRYEGFPADWNGLGRAAGPIRNEAMAVWASQASGVLIAVWDGNSRGTADMILAAHRHRLIVEVQHP